MKMKQVTFPQAFLEDEECIKHRLVRRLRGEGPVVLLESQSGIHPAGRLSYIAARPEAAITAYGSKIVVHKESREHIISEDPWKALQRFRLEEGGGWLFGYLGYDLKNHLENLVSDNPDPVGAPDLFFMVPGLLWEIDEKSSTIKMLKGELNDTWDLPEKRATVPQLQGIKPSVEKEKYLAAIREAQNRIREGAFYEVNLSHQLRGLFSGDAFKLYRQMRDAGPVPFGAYLALDSFTVCSLSPERFLKKEGRRVFSQPIKGTMKRGRNEKEDQLLKKRLSLSAKDRAENLMIVDLVRNDLSRIAKKGSVSVRDLFDIQTFGTVHQMVSTVEGEAEIEDPVEIIKACYPMGSMTGAPKISAMKAIEELENYRRGIYSGAIGYISPEDDFDFSVVIRTAVIKNSRLFYSVGGAITGDSDPEEEWEETMVKARALTDTLSF